MHEPRLLDCIFGCRDCKDRLAHYLVCPILWSILCNTFEIPIPPEIFSRMNYQNPSLIKLGYITAAFDIYHTLKIGLRTEVDSAQHIRRFGEIFRVASRTAIDFLHTHPYLFIHAHDQGSERARHPYNPHSTCNTHHIYTTNGSAAGTSDSEHELHLPSDEDFPPHHVAISA